MMRHDQLAQATSRCPVEFARSQGVPDGMFAILLRHRRQQPIMVLPLSHLTGKAARDVFVTLPFFVGVDLEAPV